MRASFTLNLILVTVIVYLLQGLIGPVYFGRLALWPVDDDGVAAMLLGAPWQLFTYSLLHGDLMHLAFNMFGVWMFGSQVEQVWGPVRTGITWLLAVLTAAITHLIVADLLYLPEAPVVGASGGVFGLMLAYALMFPHARIVLLFPPIPLPARVFVVLYAVFEMWAGVTGSIDGVAHFAHLGGLIGGWLGYRYGRAMEKRVGRR